MKRRTFIGRSMGIPVMASLPLNELAVHVKQDVDRSSNKQQGTFDVIVLGVGSMGSATCYHLAKQGHSVLGLEQFDITHEFGSHSGQSRIIRKAYFEHPDYVPILQRAYQNWKSFEEETETQLYYKTGLLYFGQSDHALIKGLRESAQKYSIEVNDLSSQQVNTQFPQFNIPKDYDRLIEPDAGFVTPEKSILLYIESALRNGAVIHTKDKALEWKKSGETISVKTNKGSYQCKKLIITAGPWSGKMIPNLSKNLKVTRQMIAWVKPKKWREFELGNFPCWTIADHERPGIYYGFPIMPMGNLMDQSD